MDAPESEPGDEDGDTLISTRKLMSLDLPWSSQGGNIGIAVATVSGKTPVNARVGVVPSSPKSNPALPQNSEVNGFIANGAGPNRDMPSDFSGPFQDGLNPTVQGRTVYLESIWGAFHAARNNFASSMPELDGPDLVVIDIPLVSGRQLSLGTVPSTRSKTFRLVEKAFTGKSPIPGGTVGSPKWLYGPFFQAGIVNGWRPGYAIAELVRCAFRAKHILESFPALVLGPLCEHGVAVGIDRIDQIAGHKPNSCNITLGQHRLLGLLMSWFGSAIRWVPQPSINPSMAADGYDALLGLLPALLWAGFVPPDALSIMPVPPWATIARLNHAPSGTSMPSKSQRGPQPRPLIGCTPWKTISPTLAQPVDDQGIACLDSAYWT